MCRYINFHMTFGSSQPIKLGSNDPAFKSRGKAGSKKENLLSFFLLS